MIRLNFHAQILRNILLTVFILFSSSQGLSETYFNEQEASLKIFPSMDYMEKKSVLLKSEVKEGIYEKTGVKPDSSVFTYTEIMKDGKTLGYILKSRAKGKHKYFTFIIGVKTDLSIKLIEILEYNESHGGEIRHRSFTSQFVSKSLFDAITIGRDIDAVTGATISSRSITKNIKYSIVCLSEYFSSIQ